MRKNRTCFIRLGAMAALLAVGCATGPDDAGEEKGPSGVDTAVTKTRSGFGDAALTPLNDLNLRRQKIPKVLRQIDSPYTPLGDTNCEDIAKRVTALDAVLGPDADAPPADDPSLNQRAGGAASDATLDAVSNTTGGVIPFRGLVRQATGASAYEKRVRRAFERGLQRRAYLKGVGGASGCEPPAAPRPPDEDDDPKIEFRGAKPAT